MANTLEVIISMIKKGTGDKEAKTGLSGLSNGFKELTGFSLGTVSALGLVGMGLQKGVKFTKEAIDETTAYNKTVREMTQVLGLSADETSRIIQVADDWGISIEQVRAALGLMNKNGVTPSIENLAKLADEYVASTNKTEFAEKATKLLGKQYQTLVPILAMGGKGFREAAAGIDESMIASEQAMKASRAYEVAMDDLGDSVTGLKYILGNKLIPTLTELLGVVNNNIDEYKNLSNVYDDLKKAEELGLVTTGDLIKVRLGLAAHTMDLNSVSKEYEDVLSKLETTELGATESERLYAIGRGRLITLTDDLAISEEELSKKTWDLSMAEEAATRATENEAAKMKDLEWIISQPLTTSIEEFNLSQGAIVTEMGKVQEEIDILNSKTYLTTEQKEELEALKQEQINLQTEYDNNAIAHEEATQRILFDLAIEKLGVEGLLNSGVFEDMAEAWGLSEDAEIQAMIAADDAVNWLRDHPGDVAGMKAILEGQATSWGLTRQEALLAREEVLRYRESINSLQDKTVHVTTYFDYIGTPPEGPIPPYVPPKPPTPPKPPIPPRPPYYPIPVQHGMNFRIPEGYPNDSFRIPLALTSGEQLIVIPRNMNKRLGNVNNFNAHFHTNAQSSTLMRDFRMMQSMAG